ncbi:hypothetical protein CPB83DRAFT_782665 [Crepidotus variabilis]|uniref:SHSP domain-containing protein n=1 Tax=Crepidotus variabilis TaxID=179855 RepID=A0A9P6JVK2_9AGAR|nr:hypothetical protein CPB83DRAFT_782665 [Crepidotus variabilis]
MNCRADPSLYTLMVAALPPSITSDMVTISANKGDRLRINAQAWGGENAAHYEWQVSFPPRDVDLSRVQARFENGGLTVRVPRFSRW